MELKLIADVGLLGMPNAGKSTLLAAVSRARPKIADYPFSTLTPQPGIAELPGDRRIVIADIPGLIKGAASGAGLGLEFLRHVERTHLLVHLIDSMPSDGGDPAEHYAAIRSELMEFDVDLTMKPDLLVISKIDLVAKEDRAEFRASFAEAIGRKPEDVLLISSATHEGLDELLEAVWKTLQTVREKEESSR
jgi:GTP-binding protein